MKKMFLIISASLLIAACNEHKSNTNDDQANKASTQELELTHFGMSKISNPKGLAVGRQCASYHYEII